MVAVFFIVGACQAFLGIILSGFSSTAQLGVAVTVASLFWALGAVVWQIEQRRTVESRDTARETVPR